MRSLSLIDQWPVDTAAAAVITSDGTVVARHGDTGRRYPIASVTKLLTAYAALIAVEEGVFELDTPAGPPGATVRDLLAHTSGLAFDQHKVQAAPRSRRIYSSAGFEQLADTLTERSGIKFTDYLREALLEPLALTATTLEGSPGAAGVSTVDDLAKFAAELQMPRLVAPTTLAEATTVVHPDLNGVLPGFGHQKPNDWGLGFEIRDRKDPHWTGTTSSPRTFGHFGQSGTFVWVDPEARAACVVLTDRDFGPWAIEAWPTLTDAVLAELR
ncbi:serine hydrolase domain-containing protein [Haloechinothrix sp. LS1_15]|uniref:serine hydrolase domain-containing protein n=1 Tax=Haloechinothrix sp. LS1_15 TaxID=2652248 RepID=UPI0029488C01|nr:serine hydrolase domain-containing protein [Haloechinothrix sp. LS1_15]MDV6013288.1 beta-lactamase family protein [Haloechinothrix sp. LS1_15]